MDENKQSEKSEDKSHPERVENHAAGKQRDQAAEEITHGTLNAQKNSELSEIQRTGKSKITGRKGAEGGPGFPSAESVFGSANAQTELRKQWNHDDRKSALIEEIRDANAQGMLLADGGFQPPKNNADTSSQEMIAAAGGFLKEHFHSKRKSDSSQHGLGRPKPEGDAKDAGQADWHREKPSSSSMQDKVYGRNHLPIPPRPESKPLDSVGGSQPEDGNKEQQPKPSNQPISIGGPGPPGDNDDNKHRYWDYDPEYGTGENFAKQHRIDPKSPQKNEGSESNSKKDLPKEAGSEKARDHALVEQHRQTLKDLPAEIEAEAHKNPDKLIEERIEELKEQIPAKSQGFGTTMSAAVAEDEKGKRYVLISTNEKGNHLRKGVETNNGETLVDGVDEDHAEMKIKQYAEQRELKLISIGATRPICDDPCQKALDETGTSYATELKSAKGKK